jgi:hypothetical protein
MKEQKYITRIAFRAIRGRQAPRITFYRTWTFGCGDFINQSFRNPTNASLRRLAIALNARQTQITFKTKGYEVRV